MPVANESLRKYHVLGEPYQKEGKWYVTISYKGFPKEVRWLTAAQYAAQKRMKRNERGISVYQKWGFSDSEPHKTIQIVGYAYYHRAQLKSLGYLYSSSLGWHKPYTGDIFSELYDLNLSFRIISWDQIIDKNGLILPEEEILCRFPNGYLAE